MDKYSCRLWARSIFFDRRIIVFTLFVGIITIFSGLIGPVRYAYLFNFHLLLWSLFCPLINVSIIWNNFFFFWIWISSQTACTYAPNHSTDSVSGCASAAYPSLSLAYYSVNSSLISHVGQGDCKLTAVHFSSFARVAVCPSVCVCVFFMNRAKFILKKAVTVRSHNLLKINFQHNLLMFYLFKLSLSFCFIVCGAHFAIHRAIKGIVCSFLRSDLEFGHRQRSTTWTKRYWTCMKSQKKKTNNKKSPTSASPVSATTYCDHFHD